MGVFYRDEYETWAELFKHYIKKLKKPVKTEELKKEVIVEDKPIEDFDLNKEERNHNK